jgi:hypothetical protein
MTKYWTTFSIILLYIIIISTSNAQTQFKPDSASTSIAPSENDMLRIIGIDSTAFPKIKTNVFIDKPCAMNGNLEKEYFDIMEDNNSVAIDNFYFVANKSGQMLDLAIAFDDTGSMDNELKSLQLKFKDLANKINSNRFDARYSLVTLKADNVTTVANWTSDADSFSKAIGKLSASGGDSGPENSLLGIETVLSFGFRPDAQKIILVVTDEPSHQKGDGGSNSSYSMEDVEKDLSNSGVLLMAISPDFTKYDPGVPRSDLPKYADIRVLATESNGLWIDMRSANFSAILEQFTGMITGTYVIEYVSPDLNLVKTRNVAIAVNAPGCVRDTGSSSYDKHEIAASLNAVGSNEPPTINNLTSDKASPQEIGTSINWIASATDPDNDNILYRFFLNDMPVSDWTGDANWAWIPINANLGSNRIEVQARDGLHAGSRGLDDRKSAEFEIIEPNKPPIINAFGYSGAANVSTNNSTMFDTVQPLEWVASAVDPDGDEILYRFFVNDDPVINWTANNTWILDWNRNYAANVNESYNRIEVWIRDGKHVGQGGFDDRRSAKFSRTNRKPYMVSLEPIKNENLTIPMQWLAKAIDPDGDEILYKFFLNGDNYTDWITSRSVEMPGNMTVNASTIEVWVRDGKHADSDGFDDRRSAKFNTESINVSKQWQKTFGGPANDVGSSAQQTSDGGYIVTGTTESIGSEDIGLWLIKTDINGSELWNKTFGKSSGDRSLTEDRGSSVKETNDGGFVVIGRTSSFGTGDYDLWLIKTDANGSELWNKTFGGLNDDWGSSVQQTNDGGYIISGTTKSFGAEGSDDVWLIKTDANGNKIWNQTFGGSAGDWGLSVRQTKDGGYVVTGYTHSLAIGGDDIWLIKTDANGNELWNQTFGGTTDDWGSSVWQTRDDGYIITGRTSSFGAGGEDIWLIKIDANGTQLWDKTFGGMKDDWGSSVQQTTDGGYIVAGWTESLGAGGDDVWLIKTDANGNELWNQTFGGSAGDWGLEVQQTGDSGYIVAGWTESLGAGGDDVWLIKTDAYGNI